jgi:quercetin dioxygenase-like cupin family protein
MPQALGFPDFVTALPKVDLPFPGVEGWMIQGNAAQVVFVEFSRPVEVPEHAHAEQWELIISGRMELRIQGESYAYGPGDRFFIPAGVPHEATVQAGYRAVIVFNEAGRYKRKDDADR